MAEILRTTFQLRRGYEEAWIRNNPILAQGEPGFVIDKNLLKIGDGIKHWKDLKYINAESEIFLADRAENFPAVGSPEKLYKASEEKQLYQWNEEEQKYEALGGVGLSTEQIDFILEEIKTISKKVETISQQLETITKEVVLNKYEVFSKPEEALVTIKENEIRIMCPKDTNWQKQNSGANANPNNYYIGLKIYAPNSNVEGFKEDLNEIIMDQTMHRFENNDFAGIEENGRKFSIIWLPVALYNEEMQSWNYYGEKSSTKKYIGWYYSVEWYDSDSKLIDSYSIRINLSNEECHLNVEPYFMGAINVDKLVQKEGEALILYGGSASDNI